MAETRPPGEGRGSAGIIAAIVGIAAVVIVAIVAVALLTDNDVVVEVAVNDREEFEARVNDQLDDIDRRIDELSTEIRDVDADARPILTAVADISDQSTWSTSARCSA
jgi:hypothetical protein